MNLFDTYTLRARVQPALIGVLPAGFLMFALLPEHPFFVTAFFSLLGAAGGTAIVAQVGRDPGKKKEKALWDSWGGPPTTRFLRHRRTTGELFAKPSTALRAYRALPKSMLDELRYVHNGCLPNAFHADR